MLLRNATVVCLDEPTSHIDAATDAKVQHVIATGFGSSTIITIAHRLHTVISFDKILSIDTGRVVEFGRPVDLLDQPGGHLATMAAALGPAATAKLRELASAASRSKDLGA